ncbi:Negative regulator of mitotic exit [Apophysomyces ossiformis]|uniref:Negative regulator of mitotic exit n=1 Tax=Apophysomyces ossiformis TaxID=679940 RepID=A0A8H7ENF7_9FUNG|nr:Negative regulator of mitotic exit [Apophysomyces ossiformis]
MPCAVYGGAPITPDEPWDPHLYMLSTNPIHTKWELVVPKNEGPTPRAGHVSVIHDNVLYIFGGVGYSHFYNDIWSYDLLTGYWTKIAAVGYIPVPRESSCAAIVDGIMYIFGGRDSDSQELGDLCAFKVRSQRWYIFQNMGPTPSARYDFTFTALKDKMYVLGGEATAGKMEDASMVYVLDNAKIKYPPEDISSFADPIPPPSSSVHTSDSTLGGEPLSTRAVKPPVLDVERRIESSQSTPLQSPRQHHDRSRIHPEHNEQGSVGTFPFEMPSPQPSSSTPIPKNSYQPPARAKGHVTSVVPEAAKRRARRHSFKTVENDTNVEDRHNQASQLLMEDMPIKQLITNGLDRMPRSGSPLQDGNQNTMKPPPRPSREGISLNSHIYDTARFSYDSVGDNGSHVARTAGIRTSDVHTTTSPADIIPPARSSSICAVGNNTRRDSERSITREYEVAWHEEREALMEEIKAKEAIIDEMKKREHWWRAELSIARKTQGVQSPSSDNKQESLDLIELQDSDPDKQKMFEQLLMMKAELQRVKDQVIEQATAASKEVDQANQMRLAALKEAAYFKSKYYSVRNKQSDALAEIEVQRSEELEKRLELALQENENNSRLLQKLQKQAQSDHTERLSADERAKEAHELAEETRKAHQKTLDELVEVHNRAMKAEAQVRDNAVRIADLTNQLADALTQASALMEDLSPMRVQLSQLEASRLAARNETATVRQKLVESMDDVLRLRTLLNEKEDSLTQAKRQLESFEIQLDIMRDTVNQAKSMASATQDPPMS